MQPSDILQQLDDIELPAEASWWPLAPGWWILGIVVLALLIGLGYYLIRRYRQLSYQREALKILQQSHAIADDLQFIRHINQLLKRVAIHLYGRQQVAKLHGAAWQQFLAHSSGLDVFTQINELNFYQAAETLRIDRAYLLSLSQQWIKRAGGRHARI